MNDSQDTDQEDLDHVKAAEFPCKNCGANIEFQPGTYVLTCAYCQHETEVPESYVEVEENDFYDALDALENQAPVQEQSTVDCTKCGAVIEKGSHETSLNCPYCDSPLVTVSRSLSLIKPGAVLPFAVTSKQASSKFKLWIKSLWFAPNALKKYATQAQKLNGMYTPYWTYDSDTLSSYTGQRGDHYYVSESYWATDAKGNSVRRTRRVRKTRWSYAQGRVRVPFDDILILASRSLPEKYVNKLTPWDIENLEPYADEYLSGFKAESYQVGLREGFDRARVVMDVDIRLSIRYDIGGDVQQISSVNTRYDDICYKYILLPVWVSAYRYNNEVYRFLINARTGEVQGERPWSYVKIFFAILFGVGAIALGIALANQ